MMAAAAAGRGVEAFFSNFADVDVVLLPGTATAGVRLRNTGDCEGVSDNVDEFDWLVFGSAADFEVRLTVTTGDGPDSGPTTGTWLTLSTTRTWSMSVASMTSKGGIWLVEIRSAASSSVLASGSVTVNVEGV